MDDDNHKASVDQESTSKQDDAQTRDLRPPHANRDKPVDQNDDKRTNNSPSDYAGLGGSVPYSRPHCNFRVVDGKRVYDDKTKQMVKWVYAIAAGIWLVIVGLIVGGPRKKLHGVLFAIEAMIICLPLVIISFNLYNMDKIGPDEELLVFNMNYLTIGLIIVVPLLTWIYDKSKANNQLVTALMVCIALILLSVLDVWVTKEYLSIVKHARSVIQTLAIFLLVYVVFLFYVSI